MPNNNITIADAILAINSNADFSYAHYETDDEIISLSIILSLVTFFHLGYDHAMFLLPVLILKNRLKANNFYFALFFLFYWYFCFGTSILNFLGLEFPYSTNMGITYTTFFSFIISLTVFLFLFSKSMKKAI